jgi:hypothetical protein
MYHVIAWSWLRLAASHIFEEGWMRGLAVTILTTLVACSKPSDAETGVQEFTGNAAVSTTSDVPAVVQTASGRYRVELAPKFDPKSLPQNADLKMADGDLVEYSIQLCDLDFANKLRANRCEVFVQPDRSGLLVGFAVLKQGQGVSIDTAVETDRQRGGLGCFVGGELENSDFDNPKGKLNITGNFEARLMYRAWEKSAGDWMVAPVSNDINAEGAIGMWYLKRLNNKLRITQERWSYCYSDHSVYIDEVFNHALSLTRVDR